MSIAPPCHSQWWVPALLRYFPHSISLCGIWTAAGAENLNDHTAAQGDRMACIVESYAAWCSRNDPGTVNAPRPPLPAVGAGGRNDRAGASRDL